MLDVSGQLLLEKRKDIGSRFGIRPSMRVIERRPVGLFTDICANRLVLLLKKMVTSGCEMFTLGSMMWF